MTHPAKKILIVDEEPDVREFVRAALEDEGYQFLLAVDGKDGFEKARADRPDLIVMDVQMPRKNGLSALYDLRRDPATKSIPVVIFTGIAEKTGVRFSADSVEEYMGERPDAFLDKPADPSELRDAVRRLLSQ